MTEWKVGDRIQLTGTVRTASGLALEVGFECKGRERCVWFALSELALAIRLDAAPPAGAEEAVLEKPIVPREGEWWVGASGRAYRLLNGRADVWRDRGWAREGCHPGHAQFHFDAYWLPLDYPSAIVVGPDGGPVAVKISPFCTKAALSGEKIVMLPGSDEEFASPALLFPGFDLEANLRYQREREQGK